MKMKWSAESSLSLLLAIFLFSVMFLSYSQWQSQQITAARRLFQQQQALLIAENQLHRRLAKSACEQRVRQNQIEFEVMCRESEIHVHFPMGDVAIRVEK